jgi:hypothetical protein
MGTLILPDWTPLYRPLTHRPESNEQPINGSGSLRTAGTGPDTCSGVLGRPAARERPSFADRAEIEARDGP